MTGQRSSFVEPFAGHYYADAVLAADELVSAPARGQVAGFDVVRQFEGPYSIVSIGRRRDGTLLAVKGFRTDAPVSAGWQATRDDEAMRMIRFGYGGLLPIEQTLSDFPGGPVRYLCMPYCQGGSLRDRLDSGAVGIAEVAYHGLVIASAMRRLHLRGLVHGDIKPQNVLLAHGADAVGGLAEPRWQTWLADLETAAAIGGSTSWRMTPDYAAPEQVAGALADPAMDIWAWGKTVQDGIDLAEPLSEGWIWLADLVTRAQSTGSTDRPTSEEIIDAYSRHTGFGDERQSWFGADIGTAVAWYPLALMSPVDTDSWKRQDGAVFFEHSQGWTAWLSECERLYDLQTPAALLRIEELCTRVLGDPADPDSTWHAFGNRNAKALPIGAAASIKLGFDASSSHPGITLDHIPRQTALHFVGLLTRALVELVEKTGEQADLDRLHTVARAWESVGEFESETATALLGQAWLSLDEPERAKPYVMRCSAAAPDNPSVLATVRLYFVVNGDRGRAARTAFLPRHPDSDGAAFRWTLLAVGDLLEAGEYDELDDILSDFPRRSVDVIDLVRAVLAGRRGPVGPDADWYALRAHCKTLGDMSLEKIMYLLEAAFQRGDLDFAIRRAEVARTRSAIRMPIHHQARAAIEAVALGCDPGSRSLTERLNNRAELWSRDGYPNDPLLGLCLVAGARWLGGGLSAEARKLVLHSARFAGTSSASTRYCASCQAVWPVAYLSLCGHCHRLFCAACTDVTRRDQLCLCGGNLVPPLVPGKPNVR